MGIYKTGIWSEGSIYERTLPEGYTELEYLESTGTQYIDTGFIPNQDTRVETKINTSVVNASKFIFGSRIDITTDAYTVFMRNNFQIVSSYNNSNNVESGFTYSLETDIFINYNKNNLYINDILYTNHTYANFQCPGNMFIFSTNTNGSFDSQAYIGKIYYFKIYDNNILVRNMIPAQRNSDNVLGLYDTVNNVFYTNSGTQDFIAGPIIETTSANVQIFKQKLPNEANVIIEPDGSKWIQLFHHNNPTGNLFEQTDSFTTGVYKDVNRWFNMNLCNKFDKWEILLKQKLTSDGTEEKYRWIQTNSPMIATFNETKAANTTFITTTGYITPDSKYGGLWCQNSSSSYLVANSNTSSSWWGATGAKTAYNGGIPGYNGKTVTSGYMDIYIRIDNDSITDALLNRLLIKNDYIEADSFIEM